MSVLWTYWIETWLDHDPVVTHDSFQSIERKTTRETVKGIDFFPVKGTSIQENRFKKTKGESTALQKLRYNITTEEKVTDKIRETGLLQRLKEVNLVLTYVKV